MKKFLTSNLQQTKRDIEGMYRWHINAAHFLRERFPGIKFLFEETMPGQNYSKKPGVNEVVLVKTGEQVMIIV